MRRLAVLLPVLMSFATASAPAAGKRKPGPDLAKMIECRATMSEYQDLGTKLGADMQGTELGWKRVEQPNPFLTEFQLPQPVKVFGHTTRQIALAGSGILAILGDGVKPEVLGAHLHLEPVAVGAGRTILARVVKQDSDPVASTTIRLNVSTVDTLPGKVLAGCEYAVDVK